MGPLEVRLKNHIGYQRWIGAPLSACPPWLLQAVHTPGKSAFLLHPSSSSPSLPLPAPGSVCMPQRRHLETACQCREQPRPLGPSQEPMLQGQPQPGRLTWFEVESRTLDRVGGHCGFCPEADVRVWYLSGRPGVGLGIQVLPSGEGLSGTPRQHVRLLSCFKTMLGLSRGGGAWWDFVLGSLCPRHEVW